VQLTLVEPFVPLVVVLPKLSVFDVVETRLLPTVPLVVVLPKLSVFVVVDTLCPSHVPLVVVLPKLSVREVVLHAACAKETNDNCPAIIRKTMMIDRIFIILE
jgi:hypothetical protein